MYKSTFYTMTTKGIKKQNGYSDGKWNYYKGLDKNDDCEKWFAIDPLTGLSVCSGTSRDNAKDNAYTQEIIHKFSVFQKTKKYTEFVNNFYNAQVGAGIIIVL